MVSNLRRGWRPWTAAVVGVVVAGLGGPGVVARMGPPGLPVSSTLEDYLLPGTQPLQPLFTPIMQSFDCILCHGGFDRTRPPIPLDVEPYRNWAGSMMGQATRDPVFWAALTVANQDAGSGGDLCLRCHTPGGWLDGRSTPTDGSALIHHFTADFDGVTCHACHRMVDPLGGAGSPPEDVAVLDELETLLFGLGLDLPSEPGSGNYIMDPMDRRRGPFDLTALPPPHFWLESPFHQESALCGTCHDVSNPLYVRQLDGTYIGLNDLDSPHPTMDKFDMFPVERTYSEWASSQFAAGGVQMNGRFGGAHPTGIMETCQDCHMPDQGTFPGCRVPGYEAGHPGMPAHFFNGANNWVLKAVDDLYTDGDPIPPALGDPVFEDESTGLTMDNIDDSIARAEQMLRDASDLELSVVGSDLKVRVINMCGHKLPTGYSAGRRMWLNVMFLDANDQLVLEHGAYDSGTGVLTTGDTKVYEAVFGLDAAAAAKTGLPAGPSFHFILNNTVIFDNRIPPIGFTNAAFEAVQAAPVGYVYADGQNYDDTLFAVPVGAAKAVVTLYFQLTSKEYIDFLRDENVTDDRGEIAHAQWVLHGKSPAVDMDTAVFVFCPADITGDGVVNVLDLIDLLLCFGQPAVAGCEAEDVNGDGSVNVLDLIDVLLLFGQACP